MSLILRCCHVLWLFLFISTSLQAQQTNTANTANSASIPGTVLFGNVRVLEASADGTSTSLTPPTNVLIRGNRIEKISSDPIPTDRRADTIIIDGKGKTLMPGMIDIHTHMMFSSLSQPVLLTSDIGFINVAAVRAAQEMLLRGFTSVRDMGGPVFGLKRGIDMGLVPGPRIWPSGAFISQTGGHGDFRLPTDVPAFPNTPTYTERLGAAMIADSPDEVRKRVREQLMLGASQIKLMAGGGIASSYDPLDVTQYTVEEIKAAVEAASNWGTYVTVHAYTPHAVRQAIEAGVQCIEHGQLLDDSTAMLMSQKGIYWSLQPFIDDGTSTFAEGSPNRRKQLEMYAGTDAAYALAKKYKIKTGWGTDILFSAANAAKQNTQLLRMTKWYKPAEILAMITATNGQILALSGLRSPYAGKIGVVESGAIADLLLVDGDPIDNLEILLDPSKNFVVIMKDGKIYKNNLSKASSDDANP